MDEKYNLLISNDELWLKGKNQPIYLKLIRKHVKYRLKQDHPYPFEINKHNERFVVSSTNPFSNTCVTNLCKVPGLNSIFIADETKLDYDHIMPKIRQILATSIGKVKTFAVRVRRANKKFPIKSMDMNKRLGAEILKEFPSLKVDLTNPCLSIQIRVLDKGIYIYTNKHEAIGGLPVGSSGHLITLISGGFDSPVASYLMSKRGCRQTFAFFHAYPYVGDEVKDKIHNLIKVLSAYQTKTRAFIIPFGKIQAILTKQVKPSYRTLIFRHVMMQTAQKLAEQVSAHGILTGDALGQVSSQTLFNLSTINNSTSLPILRPLIGFNKREIIDLAKQIGTYDISVLPFDDACSLFSSKHPITRPNDFYWNHITSQLDLENDIIEAIENSSTVLY